MAYKILYVDDDIEWRVGIDRFFKGDSTIELYIETIKDCYKVLHTIKIDIVILDTRLNVYDASGDQLALELSNLYPHIKVIILSSIENDEEIFKEAFLNGAYDYIYKSEFDKLPEVIEGAMRSTNSNYGERLKRLVHDKKKNLLTASDKMLLELILVGKTQAQVADGLKVSLAAVKKHINRLMLKFNWTRSIYELALKCKKWGFLKQ